MAKKTLTTTTDTLTAMVEYFVITKYVPQLQAEMMRYLQEYSQKAHTLDGVSDIVGFTVGGDLGTFRVGEPTAQLIENLDKAFKNELPKAEADLMLATIRQRLSSNTK